MKSVISHLTDVEKAVNDASKSIGTSTLADQFKTTARSVKTSSDTIGKNLQPLRAEFRALKAAASNIDFGDVLDDKQFKRATTAANAYVKNLKEMRRSIEGNSAAEREFSEVLKRQQRIMKDRLALHDAERKAAFFSQRKGEFTALQQVGEAALRPLNQAGKDATKIFADFDDKMSAVAAISGASSQELEKLREKAKLLGATTRFTASQAAEAETALASAGFTANQVIAGIPATLSLASAGALGLEEASSIASKTMAGMGLKVTDLGHITDVLAYSAAAANTNIQELGTAMTYAAQPAKMFGASVDETAAILGVMSNAGVSADKAGTAARSAFLRLASPPKAASNALQKYGIETKDAMGNAINAMDVFQDISDTLQIDPANLKALSEAGDDVEKMSQIGQLDKIGALKDIFGTTAVSGMAAVLTQMNEAKRISVASRGSSLETKDYEKYFASIGLNKGQEDQDIFASVIRQTKSYQESLQMMDMATTHLIQSTEYLGSLSSQDTTKLAEYFKVAPGENLFDTILKTSPDVTTAVGKVNAAMGELGIQIKGKSGAAKTMAQIMEDNLAGSFRSLSSAFEALQVNLIEPIAPLIRTAADMLTKLFLTIANLPSPIRAIISMSGALVAGFAALSVVVGAVGMTLFGFSQAAATATAAGIALQASVIPLTGFFPAAMDAFAGTSSNPFKTAGFAAEAFSDTITSASKEVNFGLGGITRNINMVSRGLVSMSLSFALSPIGIAIASFLALNAILQQINPEINLLGTLFSFVSSVAGFAVGVVQGFGEELLKALDLPISAAEGVLSSPFKAISSAIEYSMVAFEAWRKSGRSIGADIFKFIATPFDFAGRHIMAAWQTTINFIKGLLTPFAGFVTNIGKLLQGGLAEASPGPTFMIRAKWEQTINFIKGLLTPFVGFVTGIGRLLQGGLAEASPGPTFMIREKWEYTIAFLEKLFVRVRAAADLVNHAFLGIGDVTEAQKLQAQQTILQGTVDILVGAVSKLSVIGDLATYVRNFERELIHGVKENFDFLSFTLLSISSLPLTLLGQLEEGAAMIIPELAFIIGEGIPRAFLYALPGLVAIATSTGLIRGIEEGFSRALDATPRFIEGIADSIYGIFSEGMKQQLNRGLSEGFTSFARSLPAIFANAETISIEVDIDKSYEAVKAFVRGPLEGMIEYLHRVGDLSREIGAQLYEALTPLIGFDPFGSMPILSALPPLIPLLTAIIPMEKAIVTLAKSPSLAGIMKFLSGTVLPAALRTISTISALVLYTFNSIITLPILAVLQEIRSRLTPVSQILRAIVSTIQAITFLVGQALLVQINRLVMGVSRLLAEIPYIGKYLSSAFLISAKVLSNLLQLIAASIPRYLNLLIKFFPTKQIVALFSSYKKIFTDLLSGLVYIFGEGVKPFANILLQALNPQAAFKFLGLYIRTKGLAGVIKQGGFASFGQVLSLANYINPVDMALSMSKTFNEGLRVFSGEKVPLDFVSRKIAQIFQILATPEARLLAKRQERLVSLAEILKDASAPMKIFVNLIRGLMMISPIIQIIGRLSMTMMFWYNILKPINQEMLDAIANTKVLGISLKPVAQILTVMRFLVVDVGEQLFALLKAVPGMVKTIMEAFDKLGTLIGVTVHEIVGVSSILANLIKFTIINPLAGVLLAVTAAVRTALIVILEGFKLMRLKTEQYGDAIVALLHGNFMPLIQQIFSDLTGVINFSFQQTVGRVMKLITLMGQTVKTIIAETILEIVRLVRDPVGEVTRLIGVANQELSKSLDKVMVYVRQLQLDKLVKFAADFWPQLLAVATIMGRIYGLLSPIQFAIIGLIELGAFLSYEYATGFQNLDKIITALQHPINALNMAIQGIAGFLGLYVSPDLTGFIANLAEQFVRFLPVIASGVFFISLLLTRNIGEAFQLISTKVMLFIGKILQVSQAIASVGDRVREVAGSAKIQVGLSDAANQVRRRQNLGGIANPFAYSRDYQAQQQATYLGDQRVAKSKAALKYQEELSKSEKQVQARAERALIDQVKKGTDFGKSMLDAQRSYYFRGNNGVTEARSGAAVEKRRNRFGIEEYKVTALGREIMKNSGEGGASLKTGKDPESEALRAAAAKKSGLDVAFSRFGAAPTNEELMNLTEGDKAIKQILGNFQKAVSNLHLEDIKVDYLYVSKFRMPEVSKNRPDTPEAFDIQLKQFREKNPTNEILKNAVTAEKMRKDLADKTKNPAQVIAQLFGKQNANELGPNGPVGINTSTANDYSNEIIAARQIKNPKEYNRILTEKIRGLSEIQANAIAEIIPEFGKFEKANREAIKEANRLKDIGPVVTGFGDVAAQGFKNFGRAADEASQEMENAAQQSRQSLSRTLFGWTGLPQMFEKLRFDQAIARQTRIVEQRVDYITREQTVKAEAFRKARQRGLEALAKNSLYEGDGTVESLTRLLDAPDKSKLRGFFDNFMKEGKFTRKVEGDELSELRTQVGKLGTGDKYGGSKGLETLLEKLKDPALGFNKQHLQDLRKFIKEGIGDQKGELSEEAFKSLAQKLSNKLGIQGNQLKALRSVLVDKDMTQVFEQFLLTGDFVVKATKEQEDEIAKLLGMASGRELRRIDKVKLRNPIEQMKLNFQLYYESIDEKMEQVNQGVLGQFRKLEVFLYRIPFVDGEEVVRPLQKFYEGIYSGVVQAKKQTGEFIANTYKAAETNIKQSKFVSRLMSVNADYNRQKANSLDGIMKEGGKKAPKDRSQLQSRMFAALAKAGIKERLDQDKALLAVLRDQKGADGKSMSIDTKLTKMGLGQHMEGIHKALAESLGVTEDRARQIAKDPKYTAKAVAPYQLFLLKALPDLTKGFLSGVTTLVARTGVGGILKRIARDVSPALGTPFLNGIASLVDRTRIILATGTNRVAREVEALVGRNPFSNFLNGFSRFLSKSGEQLSRFFSTRALEINSERSKSWSAGIVDKTTEFFKVVSGIMTNARNQAQAEGSGILGVISGLFSGVKNFFSRMFSPNLGNLQEERTRQLARVTESGPDTRVGKMAQQRADNLGQQIAKIETVNRHNESIARQRAEIERQRQSVIGSRNTTARDTDNIAKFREKRERAERIRQFALSRNNTGAASRAEALIASLRTQEEQIRNDRRTRALQSVGLRAGIARNSDRSSRALARESVRPRVGTARNRGSIQQQEAAFQESQSQRPPRASIVPGVKSFFANLASQTAEVANQVRERSYEQQTGNIPSTHREERRGGGRFYRSLRNRGEMSSNDAQFESGMAEYSRDVVPITKQVAAEMLKNASGAATGISNYFKGAANRTEGAWEAATAKITGDNWWAMVKRAAWAGTRILSSLNCRASDGTTEAWKATEHSTGANMRQMAQVAGTTGSAIAQEMQQAATASGTSVQHAAQVAEVAGTQTAQSVQHAGQAAENAIAQIPQAAQQATNRTVGMFRHMGQAIGSVGKAGLAVGGVVTAAGFAAQTVSYSLSNIGLIDEETAQKLNKFTELFTIMGAVAGLATPILSAMGAVVAVIGSVTAVAATGVMGLGTAIAGLIGVAGLPMAPFILGIAGIAAAVAGLYLAFKNNFLGIQTLAQSVGKMLMYYLSEPIAFIQAGWQKFTDAFGGKLMAVIQPAIDIGQQLINALNHNPTEKIPLAWEGAREKIQGSLGGLLSFAIGIGGGLASGISGFAQEAANTVGGFFAPVLGIFNRVKRGTEETANLPQVQSIAQGVILTSSKVSQPISSPITPAPESPGLLAGVGATLGWIGSRIQDLFNGAIASVSGAIHNIIATVSAPIIWAAAQLAPAILAANQLASFFKSLTIIVQSVLYLQKALNPLQQQGVALNEGILAIATFFYNLRGIVESIDFFRTRFFGGTMVERGESTAPSRAIMAEKSTASSGLLGGAADASKNAVALTNSFTALQTSLPAAIAVAGGLAAGAGQAWNMATEKIGGFFNPPQASPQQASVPMTQREKYVEKKTYLAAKAGIGAFHEAGNNTAMSGDIAQPGGTLVASVAGINDLGAANTKAAWANTTASISQNINSLVQPAEASGYELQKAVSEGSPGPTYWIRYYWEKTVGALGGWMGDIQRDARQTGNSLHTSLANGASEILMSPPKSDIKSQAIRAASYFMLAVGDRYQYLADRGIGSAGALFAPGMEYVKSSLGNLAGDFVDFGKRSAKALVTLNFFELGAAASDFFGNFKYGVGGVLSGFSSMSLSAIAFGMFSLSGISPLILALGAVAFAAAVITANFLGIRTILTGLGKIGFGVGKILFSVLWGVAEAAGAFKKVLQGILPALRGDFTLMNEGFRDLGLAFWKVHRSIGDGLKIIKDGFFQVFAGIGEALEQIFKPLGFTAKAATEAIQNFFAAFKNGEQAGEMVAELLIATVKSVSSAINIAIAKIKEAIPVAKQLFASAIEQGVESLRTGIAELQELIKNFTFKDAIAKIKGLFGTAGDSVGGIPDVIEGVMPRIIATLTAPLKYVGDFWRGFFRRILAELPPDIADAVRDGFTRAIAAVEPTFRQILQSLNIEQHFDRVIVFIQSKWTQLTAWLGQNDLFKVAGDRLREAFKPENISQAFVTTIKFLENTWNRFVGWMATTNVFDWLFKTIKGLALEFTLLMDLMGQGWLDFREKLANPSEMFDGFFSGLRDLGARFSEWAINAGVALQMPALEDLFVKIATLGEKFAHLATFIQTQWNKVSIWLSETPLIPGAFDFLVKLGIKIGGLMDWLQSRWPELIKFLTSTDVFAKIFTKLKEFGANIPVIFEQVKASLANVIPLALSSLDSLKEKAGQLIDWGKTKWTQLIAVITSTDFFSRIIAKFKEVIANIPAILQAIKTEAIIIFSDIPKALGRAANWIQGKWQKFAVEFRAILKPITDFAEWLGQRLIAALNCSPTIKIPLAWKEAAKSIIGSIRSLLAPAIWVADRIIEVLHLTQVRDSIKSLLGFAGGFVSGFVSTIAPALNDFIDLVGSGVKHATSFVQTLMTIASNVQKGANASEEMSERLTTVSSAMQHLGKFLGWILKGIEQFSQGMTKSGQDLNQASAAGRTFGTVIGGLTGTFVQFARIVLPPLFKVLWIFTQVGIEAAAFAVKVAWSFRYIINWALRIQLGFVELGFAVFGFVKSAVKGFFEVISAFRDMGRGLADFVTNFGSGLRELGKALLNLGAAILDVFSPEMTNAIRQTFSTIAEMVGQVKEFVTETIGFQVTFKTAMIAIAGTIATVMATFLSPISPAIIPVLALLGKLAASLGILKFATEPLKASIEMLGGTSNKFALTIKAVALTVTAALAVLNPMFLPLTLAVWKTIGGFEALKSVIRLVGEGFQFIRDRFQYVTLAASALPLAVQPLVTLLSKLDTKFKVAGLAAGILLAAMQPALWPIAAIIAVGANLGLVRDHFGKISMAVAALVLAFKPMLAVFLAGGNIVAVLSAVNPLLLPIVATIGLMSGAFNPLFKRIGALVPLVKSIALAMVPVLKPFFDNLNIAISAVFFTIKNNFTRIITAIATFFLALKPMFAAFMAGSGILTILGSINPLLLPVVATIALMTGGFDKLANFIDNVVSRILAFVKPLTDALNITPFVENVITTSTGAITGGLRKINSVFDTFVFVLKTSFVDLISTIKNEIKTLIFVFKTSFVDIVNQLKSSVGKMAAAFIASSNPVVIALREVFSALAKIGKTILQLVGDVSIFGFRIGSVFTDIVSSITKVLVSFVGLLGRIAAPFGPIGIALAFIGAGKATFEFIASVARLTAEAIPALGELGTAIMKYLEEPLKSVGAIWDKTGGKIVNAIGGLRRKAKETGQELQGDLSEASPGPTYWIRRNWIKTTDTVQAKLSELAMTAKAEGGAIYGFLDRSLTAISPRKVTEAQQAIDGLSLVARRPRNETELVAAQKQIEFAQKRLATEKAIITEQKKNGQISDGLYTEAISKMKQVDASHQQVISSLKEEAGVMKAAKAQQEQLGQSARSVMMSLGSSLSNFAPQLATPIFMINDLVTSFFDIKSALPGIQAFYAANVAASVTADSAIASSALAKAGIVGGANATIAASYGFVSAAAKLAYKSMIAPLLPILPLILKVTAVLFLLHQAFKNNFFGIADTISGVGNSIKEFFDVVFSGAWHAISSVFHTLQQSLAQITRSIGILIRTVIYPFQRIFSLITGSQSTIGGSFNILNGLVGALLFPLRLVASILSTVIRLFGGVIQSAIALGTIIADFLLLPVRILGDLIYAVQLKFGELRFAGVQAFSIFSYLPSVISNQMASAIGSLLNPLNLISAIFRAIGGTLNFISGLISGVAHILIQTVVPVALLIGKAIAIVAGGVIFFANISSIILVIGSGIAAATAGTTSFLGAVSIIAAFVAAVGGFVQAIAFAAIPAMIAAISPLIGTVAFFAAVLAGVVAASFVIVNAFNLIWQIGSKLFSGLGAIVGSVFSVFWVELKNVWTALAELGSQIIEPFKQLAGAIGSLFTGGNLGVDLSGLISLVVNGLLLPMKIIAGGLILAIRAISFALIGIIKVLGFALSILGKLVKSALIVGAAIAGIFGGFAFVANIGAVITGVLGVVAAIGTALSGIGTALVTVGGLIATFVVPALIGGIGAVMAGISAAAVAAAPFLAIIISVVAVGWVLKQTFVLVGSTIIGVFKGVWNLVQWIVSSTVGFMAKLPFVGGFFAPQQQPKPPGFAVGGLISGPGTSTGDRVPVLASPGEFIVNAAAVRSNLPLLESVNQGTSVQVSNIKPVPTPATPVPSAPATSTQPPEINVQFNFGDIVVQNANPANAAQEFLSEFIKSLESPQAQRVIRTQLRDIVEKSKG